MHQPEKGFGRWPSLGSNRATQDAGYWKIKVFVGIPVPRNKKCPPKPSKTNILAPENGWFGLLVSFWVPAYFQVCWLLVSVILADVIPVVTGILGCGATTPNHNWTNDSPSRQDPFCNLKPRYAGVKCGNFLMFFLGDTFLIPEKPGEFCQMIATLPVKIGKKTCEMSPKFCALNSRCEFYSFALTYTKWF